MTIACKGLKVKAIGQIQCHEVMGHANVVGPTSNDDSFFSC